MEKQEMLTAWNQLQGRVEKCVALQTALFDEVHQLKMKRIRNRTLWSPIGDLVLCGIAVILLGGFMASNLGGFRSAPVTALPALVIFAFSILLINLSIRQLIHTAELDYAKPVLDTQVHLAKLRKLRLQAVQATFLFALPTWVVFPLLLGQMLIDVKFVLAVNGAWVIGNVLLGLALTPVVNWALKRSKYSRSLQDAIVGKDILEAESFLQQIEEFRSN